MTTWFYFKEQVPYLAAINLMETYVQKIINKQCTDTILLLEHPHVFTVGTSKGEHQSLEEDNDISVIQTNRGGKITYHGPNQRIIYPIIDLNEERDVRKFVNDLQDWIINTLKHFAIKGVKLQEHPGIWVLINNIHYKIASIGIRLRKWVSYHGIAVNLAPDMSYFSRITPCGITDVKMTSFQDLGIKYSLTEFDEALKIEYYRIFSR
jgi:lipoyl(octanoyl) transferase